MEDRNIGFLIPYNSAEWFLNKIITNKIPSDFKKKIIRHFKIRVEADSPFNKICFNNYNILIFLFIQIYIIIQIKLEFKL